MATLDRARTDRRRVRATLALGFVATIVVSLVVFVRAGEVDETRSDVEVNAASSALELSLRNLSASVTSVAQLFNAVGEVSGNEFVRFSNGILSLHPEVLNLQYDLAVRGGRERRAYERELRLAGRGTEITTFGAAGFERAPRAPLYLPLTYEAPVRPQLPRYGLDIYSIPQLRALVDEAIAINSQVVGAPITGALLADTGSIVQATAPVYLNGRAPRTEEARLEALKGTIFAAIGVDVLMSSVVAPEATSEASLALVGTSQITGESTMLWSSESPAPSIEEVVTWPSADTIAVPGTELTVYGYPTGSAVLSPLLWLVPIMGVVITILVTALTGAQQRADEAVDNTRALRSQQDRFRQLAHQDHLTGLRNRAGFLAWLTEQEPDVPIVVLYVDVVGYSDLHSVYGGRGADQILRQIGRRLRTLAGDASLTVARVGGDKFVVGAHMAHGPDSLLQRVHSVISRPTDVNGATIVPNVAIGAVHANNLPDRPTILLEQAEIACRMARRRNEESLLYTDELAAEVRTESALADGLRRAVRDPESHFHLVYLPFVRTADGAISGAEALLRWRFEDESIPPNDFIPMAESLGLMSELGAWVLRRACEDRAEIGLDLVAVNISSPQLTASNVKDLVKDILSETGCPASSLEIEVTEDVVNRSVTSARLAELHRLGVRISIDDFGAGSGSLNNLTRVSLSRLKIDRSFISRLSSRPESEAVVRAVLALAASLRLEVVAEGVESAGTASRLGELGVPICQGFHFGQPVNAAELKRLLELRVTLPADGDWTV